MIGYLIFLVAVSGTLLASYFDLKTTNVPDYIAIYMAVFGIVLNGLASILAADFFFLQMSLLFGIIFTVIGAIKYYVKMWGGADFLILGSLGFLIPYLPSNFSPTYVSSIWPFPLTIFFNLLLLGAVYSIIYAIYYSLRNKETFVFFIEKVLRYKGHFLILTGIYLLLSFFSLIIFPRAISKFIPLALAGYFIFAFLSLLYIFLYTIQKNFMERKILSKNLKEGDVLAEDVKLSKIHLFAKRIEGLTNKQIRLIQNERSYVKIMEGIPYIPSFFFSVIVSFTFGDILTWLFFSF